MNLKNIFQFLLIITICSIIVTSNECPGCLCIPSIAHLTMQCPAPPSDVRIHVSIQTGQADKSSALIDCDGLQANEFNILPNMNVGEIQTVTIRKCPLPLGTPLNNIIKRLGMTNVRVLFFDRGQNEKMKLIHLKGLNDLRRLRLSGIDFTDMPDNIFSEVPNLSWLDLRSNNFILPNNIFAPLQNLEYLELGHNKLNDLLPGTFRNQKRLVHLNLWGNNLTNLSKLAFEGATSITDLDLSANNIEQLQSDVFALLKNLTNINLSGNHLTILPEHLFDDNKNLVMIRLTNNRVPLIELPEKLFSNFTELKVLSVTCDLEIIPNNLFEGSNNLQNITFSRNKLEKLPDHLWTNHTELLNIDLSYNKLILLPDDLLANARKLVELNLSYNQLVNISREFFLGLSSLEVLKINNNRLITLPQQTFQTYTPNLLTIELENNQISFQTDDDDINSPLNGLKKLVSLKLRNNSVTRIASDWMYELLDLKELDLSYNKFEHFSTDDLQFSSKDITVDLRFNNITKINFNYIGIYEKNINDYRKMKFLLDNNPIYCNCEILLFVKFMKGAVQPQLKSIFIIEADNLECDGPINMIDKKINEIDTKDLLCPVDNLCSKTCKCNARPDDDHLIMSCNNAGLTEIPFIPHLGRTILKHIELHIENNFIKQLPKLNTGGYVNVTKIHAHNNQISNIHLDNLPKKLKLLDVSKNQLKQLNDSIIEEFEKRKNFKISLADNPWHCSCQLEKLLSFTKTHYKNITDLNQMKCESGQPGKYISKINLNDICNEQGLIIAGSILIALFGLCLGILAALYYKYNLEIKVWLYAHNMCLWFVTEDELDKDKKYDAFISYSTKDDEFITEYLVPELENGINPFKLCVHYRDWVGGEFIPDQIARSVEESRRTIVILSVNFLESIWGRMEFRTAHQAALSEGRARVIVIIYGDIGDIDQLDSELKAYLKMNTYIKWGDPWFWNKLRYALPHPRNMIQNNRTNGLIKSAIKSSIDDRLELIKPIAVTPPLTTPPAEQASKNPLLSKLNGNVGNHHNNSIDTNGHTLLQKQQQQQKQQQNGKLSNGINGHINGAFIINTNAKQSDV